MSDTLDRLCITTIRFLSVDAVQKANSGHVGQDEQSHDAETNPLRNPEEFQFVLDLPEIADRREETR